MKHEFSGQIFEKSSYQISRKSVRWDPSCSMRTDRRTDMKNLIVAFRDFANAPKTGEAWEPTEMCVTSFFDTHKVKWLVHTITTTFDYILLYDLLLYVIDQHICPK